jgi:hypothetical protein
MNLKIRATLLLCAALFASFNAPAKTPSGLKGRVVDGFQAPIGNVFVLVHGIRGSDEFCKTDPSGQYSVELPAGVYDVFFSSPGFSPALPESRDQVRYADPE